MLIRQKAILDLLLQVTKPLSPTVFVKLVFLLRHETQLKYAEAFYDFVPYKYGPFSFTLYHEIAALRRDGYMTPDEESIALCGSTLHLTKQKVDELPISFRRAVGDVVDSYGSKNQTDLLKDVYTRYQWYATKSELTGLRPKSSVAAKKARPAVYTAGYEGKSVDSFFDRLLRSGMELVIDVRAMPLSRRYGFSKRQFGEIAKKLGLEYLHFGKLGIPSEHRANLTDFDSYQRLLREYQHNMLPRLENEIAEVGQLMQRTLAVLVCVENDFRCCHRSRLAEAISRRAGLKVEHLCL